MKAKSVLLVMGGIALGMLLGVLALRLIDTSSRVRSELAVGTPAPEFELESLAGGKARLADYRGKAVLLNFWATWCAPCKKEMPLFEVRSQRYKDQLVVIGVNLGEGREEVQAFAKEMEINFPVLLEPSGKASAAYNVSGYPSTFFIDQEGILQSIYIGEISETRLDQALAEIGIKP